ncbi:MAG: hypothetical protein ABW067_00305, partial [Rhizobacter sp.]
MSACWKASARRAVWGGAVLALAGCSPTYDWRELRPDGLGVVTMFPCKPTREARSVALAGAPATMTLLACAAGGATFGLAVIDVPDPGRRAAVRDALRDAVAAN